MEPCFLLGLFNMSWSQQKRGGGRVFGDVWHGLVDGFVFAIGIRFQHIYVETRKTHNHNRCILHGPYLFYEISVIDVPQSHPSFVPFVLWRSFVFNDTCSCVEQGRRAGRRTWRKRQTMTFTLSIFLLSKWSLQAQAIMWDKRWCGACGPHNPGPEFHDLMLNMVSPCPLSPRYNTSYHSRKN